MSTAAARAREFADDIWNRAFLPPPSLTVDQWADRNRHLSTKETGIPGPWRTDRVPYLRKIMQELSPQSRAETVVMMKGAQLGGSEAGLNWLGYSVDQDPCPIMLVMPTIETGRDYSRQRLEELLRQTPCLAGKVSTRRDPTGGSTQLVKDYAGGMILIRGSNSPSGLRSNPIKKLLLEEVDAYEPSAGQEGDPVMLAQMRTATFRRRKILMVSTPKREGTSRIVREFARCEQAWDYQVPCPQCGHRQTLTWDRIRYELPEGWSQEQVGEFVEIPGVEYECAGCGERISEYLKPRMLSEGAWVARWNRGEKSVAFHLSALYSPWFSWGRCAAMFERGRQRPEEMQVFVNTILGQPYDEPTEAPDWQALYARRMPYAIGTVPVGGLFLTAGVDVQADRLEAEVVAWGLEKRSWSVLHAVLVGDTSTDAPWTELDHLLAEDFPTAWGTTLPIQCLAVDAGAVTQSVYRWARKHQAPTFGGGIPVARHPRTVMAIVGRDKWGKILYAPEKASADEKKRGLRVVTVGVSGAKRELYAWLRQRIEDDGRVPHGYCRFPEYPEDYFRQLTAERLLVEWYRGFPREVWTKPQHARNEVLDCRIYARAAFAACGGDRMRAAEWAKLERRVRPAEGVALVPLPDVPAPVPVPEPLEAGPPPPSVQPLARHRVIRSSFIGRYRR